MAQVMARLLLKLGCLLSMAPQVHAALRASAAQRLSIQATSAQEIRRNETVDEIKAKWDNMDEFLEIMFTLACKWQHGKDVQGLTAEKLQAGEIEAGKEVDEFRAQTQAGNVQMLKRACGMIVSEGEAKCRKSCAARWNEAMDKRDSCDEKCVAVYDRFETQCGLKVAHLEEVYAQKLQKISGQQQCFEGHCSKFPTVWMKEDAASMKSELDSRCQTLCEADQVEIRCQRRWQLEADVYEAKAKSECHGEGAVEECFQGKKIAAAQAQGTCSDQGLATCESQYQSCVAAAGGSSFIQKDHSAQAPAKGLEFCAERKKMCDSQVRQDCLNDMNAELEHAKTECQTDDKEAAKVCTEDKMQTAATQHVQDCVSKLTPKCTQECHSDCEVDSLVTCMDNLKSDHDATEDFCTDLWKLLHESSEVDPETGDPIVLLAPHGGAIVKRSA